MKRQNTRPDPELAELDLDTLIRQFLERTLPKRAWTHAAHLAVGAWHVHRYGTDDALVRLRSGIRALNDAHGTPNTDTSGYHETITRVYVHLIADTLATLPSGASAADGVRAVLAGPVAARDLPLRYYSRDRLFSVDARRAWVEPDLEPLTHQRPPSPTGLTRAARRRG